MYSSDELEFEEFKKVKHNKEENGTEMKKKMFPRESISISLLVIHKKMNEIVHNSHSFHAPIKKSTITPLFHDKLSLNAFKLYIQ